MCLFLMQSYSPPLRRYKLHHRRRRRRQHRTPTRSVTATDRTTREGESPVQSPNGEVGSAGDLALLAWTLGRRLGACRMRWIVFELVVCRADAIEKLNFPSYLFSNVKHQPWAFPVASPQPSIGLGQQRRPQPFVANKSLQRLRDVAPHPPPSSWLLLRNRNRNTTKPPPRRTTRTSTNCLPSNVVVRRCPQAHTAGSTPPPPPCLSSAAAGSCRSFSFSSVVLAPATFALPTATRALCPREGDRRVPVFPPFP